MTSGKRDGAEDALGNMSLRATVDVDCPESCKVRKDTEMRDKSTEQRRRAITPRELDEIIDKLVSTLEARFPKEGTVPPSFVIIDRQSVLTPVETRFRDERDKAAVVSFISKICRETDAVAVVFAGEAWISTSAPTRRVQPSLAPDRQEVVLMSAETCEGTMAYTWPILRDRGHVRLGERDQSRQCSGQFSNLLKQPAFN